MVGVLISGNRVERAARVRNYGPWCNQSVLYRSRETSVALDRGSSKLCVAFGGGRIVNVGWSPNDQEEDHDNDQESHGQKDFDDNGIVENDEEVDEWRNCGDEGTRWWLDDRGCSPGD